MGPGKLVSKVRIPRVSSTGLQEQGSWTRTRLASCQGVVPRTSLANSQGAGTRTRLTGRPVPKGQPIPSPPPPLWKSAGSRPVDGIILSNVFDAPNFPSFDAVSFISGHVL